MEKIQIGILHWLLAGANKKIDSETDEYKRAKYVIAVTLDSISKFFITGTIALLLDVGKYFLFFTLIYGSLKIFAYGAHLQNSFHCLLAGIITYFGSIFFSRCLLSFSMSNHYLLYIITFGLSYIAYIKYAPAVSKNQLLSIKKIKPFKFVICVYISILFVLQFFLPTIYRLLITMAVVAEAFHVLPLTFYLYGERM